PAPPLSQSPPPQGSTSPPPPAPEPPVGPGPRSFPPPHDPPARYRDPETAAVQHEAAREPTGTGRLGTAAATHEPSARESDADLTAAPPEPTPGTPTRTSLPAPPPIGNVDVGPG